MAPFNFITSSFAKKVWNLASSLPIHSYRTFRSNEESELLPDAVAICVFGGPSKLRLLAEPAKHAILNGFLMLSICVPPSQLIHCLLEHGESFRSEVYNTTHDVQLHATMFMTR
jgi:hypothetical protein